MYAYEASMKELVSSHLVNTMEKITRFMILFSIVSESKYHILNENSIWKNIRCYRDGNSETMFTKNETILIIKKNIFTPIFYPLAQTMDRTWTLNLRVIIYDNNYSSIIDIYFYETFSTLSQTFSTCAKLFRHPVWH